jgi:two-component system chemotaxis response regulator CheY
VTVKILIVDDSAISRKTLKRILEADGHTVLEANDGIAAIELFFIEKPDLVLLDLVMTGMYGLDVLAKLREIDPAVRVVIASADIQASTREMAGEAGAIGFVNKPFTQAEVAAAVRSALQETPDGAS